MITKEEIIEASGLHPLRVMNIYIFGSRVYGNSSKTSDWDIIIVAKTPSPEREINKGDFNIHILSPDRFEEGLKNHNIRNIECVMAPKWAILQEKIKYSFDVINARLRHSISHTNSNSWVKAKKKIAQGDYYSGIKSLWHSMRIAMFGSQIARYGKINDWDCANGLWNEIISKTWTWDELSERFHKYNNELLSGFRIFAHK